jgi:hypothetical protein
VDEEEEYPEAIKKLKNQKCRKGTPAESATGI